MACFEFANGLTGKNFNLSAEKQTLDNPFQIFPLGDSAATIDLGNAISKSLNAKARSMQQWMEDHPLDAVRDMITGYSSLSVLYDPVEVKKKYAPKGTAFEFIRERLIEAWNQSGDHPPRKNPDTIRIPVCYDEEFAPDLELVAREKGISKEEVIQLHSERVYYIYMIGFLPGFSYMAEIDDRLVISRKANPVTVAAGSVGIAGRQTGIYPLLCPGGWQIIGRTPLKLFDAHSMEPVKLKAGDEVRFYPIGKNEFRDYRQV